MSQMLLTLRLGTESIIINQQQQQQVVPLLRWLRTTIPIQLHTEEGSVAFRLLPQTMVEHVVLKGQATSDVHVTLLALPCLMSLDLGDVYGVNDAFLRPIAQRHPRLRRLYLRYAARVSQSCLEGFRDLEELGVSGCKNINNVHFCAGTLRVLYAQDTWINDAGLANAVHLEVLNVCDCRGVTSVAPFAATLGSLRAGFGCGINDSSLVHAMNLQTLDMSDNHHITTLQPFAHSLKELIARYCCWLDSAALAQATRLVKLDVTDNYRLRNDGISFVSPSVRELKARGAWSSVTDRSLVDATQIVSLDVSDNPNVTLLKPFAETLRWLDASDEDCGISNASLKDVKHLAYLNTCRNPKVTKESTERDSHGYLRADSL